ncbi:MAG TPA: ammonium transporter [Thermoanaerobaculia bacterium]|nr:ammonium transporter [Thermoanaerobaculia bacterium]
MSRFAIVGAAALLLAGPAFGQSGQEIAANAVDTGDTAFVLLCAALVMLMTPGLAFFYGGMVRGKNVLATLMQSFVALAIVGVQWVLWGYTLAFGPDIGGFIGGLGFLGLSNVGLEPNADYAATIPHQTFMIYQCMFAIITPALITGAIAERMRFKTFLVFMVLWATLVYDPIAHWVWAVGGYLRGMGALDFAGGTVVHISSGVSALVAAIVLGRRRGFPDTPMPPHNLPFTLLGAGLLWFGWFGFNAGSALSAGGLATGAFVATNTAAAAATLAWILMDWFVKGKPTALGAASGAVAGLVAITPAAGFVSPLAALAIGALGGMVCFGVVSYRARTGIDDSLDVFGVHGIGGTVGALLTGVFASTAVNSGGGDGLLHGNPSLLGVQALAVLITWVYSALVTFVILKVLDVVMGLRVSSEAEEGGLDVDQHRESAYAT